MNDTIPADLVRYGTGDQSVERELDDLRRRVQTHNDLIAHLITRVQALESR